MSARGLAVLGGGTALAAVLGLGFQSLLAYWFGVSAETDAYFMSLSIYGFLGKLLMLSHVRSLALPRYARLAAADPARARAFAGGLVMLTTVGTLVLSALLFAAAPFLVDALAPGYEGELRALTVALVRIRVPALVFLGATTVTMAFLESEQRFGVTISAHKVVPAAVALGLLLLVADRSGIGAVAWIGLAATLAGALLIVPAARARMAASGLAAAARDPEIRAVGAGWLGLSGSNAATFVGEWAFRVGASLLPVGLFSAVVYGRTTHDLLHAAVNDSAQTVALPRFAAALSANHGAGAADPSSADARLGPVLRSTLAALAALSLPLTLLAMATAPWTVALLFGRGRFLADGMLEPAATSLALFMAGFFLQGLVQILFSAAFATHRPDLINRAQLVGHLARAAALVPLVRAFSYIGLVGAQVAMNALVLALLVAWAPRGWGLAGALRPGLLRPVAAAVLPAALYVLAVAPRLPDPLALGAAGRFGVMAAIGAVWLVAYTALALALRLPEMEPLRRRLRGGVAPAAAALVLLGALPARARAQDGPGWSPVAEDHWSLAVLEWMEARGSAPAGASSVRPLPAAAVGALLAGEAVGARFDEERRGTLVSWLAPALGLRARAGDGDGVVPLLALDAGTLSSAPFAFLQLERDRVVRGGVGLKLGPFWAAVGRERHRLGGGATGALALNPAVPLDGITLGTAEPVRLPVLGAVAVVAGLGPLGRYEAVHDPWWGLMRATARPASWLQLGLSRAAVGGGRFPGGTVAFDPKPYGPDLGSADAGDVARMILGLSTDYDDQIAALDVRVSLAGAGLPLLAVAEVGWEDRDRSWGDPALLASVLWAVAAPLPVTLRYEYAAFGRSARVCGWCDTLPAFWYQHVRFQSGWRVRDDLLGHPLGGYGRQHTVAAAAWSPGGRVRGRLRASSIRRDRWNLLVDERPGTAWGVDGGAAWRLGRGELTAALRTERGEGWRRQQADLGFVAWF